MTNFSSLLSIAPANSTAPDYKEFPFDHDFVLDGAPQSFSRNRDGSLIIARGAEIVTQYGIGYVERRAISGRYIVRITDFDGTAEFARYADTALRPATHYVTAKDAVSELSNCYNRRILERSEFFENRLKDVAYADELLDLLIDADCYETSLTGGDYCGATEFVYKRAINPIARERKTAETAAYRARIKALADAMLDDADDADVIPDDIAGELSEVFGD